VVVKSIPDNSVVVGVPEQNVARSEPHHTSDTPDLDHNALLDLVGVSLNDLIKRVEALENQKEVHENGKQHIHSTTDGTWHGEDLES
jgi:serine O-acetyltransferase